MHNSFGIPKDVKHHLFRCSDFFAVVKICGNILWVLVLIEDRNSKSMTHPRSQNSTKISHRGSSAPKVLCCFHFSGYQFWHPFAADSSVIKLSFFILLIVPSATPVSLANSLCIISRFAWIIFIDLFFHFSWLAHF